MRTTLDLPDALFRRAKIEAVHRGITFRALVSSAIEREIAPARDRPLGRRAVLPLIRSRTPAVYDLKPERVSEILLREECAAYEAAGRR
jgi:hypothetical protein